MRQRIGVHADLARGEACRDGARALQVTAVDGRRQTVARVVRCRYGRVIRPIKGDKVRLNGPKVSSSRKAPCGTSAKTVAG